MFRPLNRYDNLKKEPLSLMHKTTLRIICKILKIDDRFFSVSLATTQNNYDWRWAFFFFIHNAFAFNCEFQNYRFLSTIEFSGMLNAFAMMAILRGSAKKKRFHQSSQSIDLKQSELCFIMDMEISFQRDIYQLGVMYTISNSHMISIESLKWRERETHSPTIATRQQQQQKLYHENTNK